ncbi:sugar phosphate nucleotidyltransferase [Thermodesulfovibrionales bacterium]|nr:sugar phosphate nucleotidyltransferase [Thermodesulfovibrionales bacterium]
MSDGEQMRVVILAGGRGTRLKPYTTIFPKPLMPIDDMPILEVVIRQLKRAGLAKITMAVGHLAGLLEAYFNDGNKWGVKIDYSPEDKPLGTAGPLGLIEGLSDTFLVMNGDILTTLDYAELIEYHRREQAIATVAMYDKEVEITLGVLKANEKNEIYDYIEKPTIKYQVSMGIYVFEPKVLEYITPGESFDLPDLIKNLIEHDELGRKGRKLVEEKYGWQETARKVAEVLQEAIATKGRKAKVF